VRLVLASRSPQRRAILSAVGIEFELRPADVAEQDRGDPAAVARSNALRKANAALPADGELVLGVDTVVALDGRIHGKPADDAQARATLRALSGRTHHVLSALALVAVGERPQTIVSDTAVEFRVLSTSLLDWYLEREEWRERAGGYAIQGAGAVLVKRIAGDYLGVVGLPLASLLELRPELLERR
jgi:septum formation protein